MLTDIALYSIRIPVFKEQFFKVLSYMNGDLIMLIFSYHLRLNLQVSRYFKSYLKYYPLLHFVNKKNTYLRIFTSKMQWFQIQEIIIIILLSTSPLEQVATQGQFKAEFNRF